MIFAQLVRIASIGVLHRTLEAADSIVNKTQELYEISARFYLAMQTKASSLEANALQDEVLVSTLKHAGHIQRHERLVRAQRMQAGRLREFLANARVRVSEESGEA